VSKSAKHAQALTAATHSFAVPINDFVLHLGYWGVVFLCSVPDSLGSETNRHFPMAMSGEYITARLDLSYLGPPKAPWRRELVSLQPSTLLSWGASAQQVVWVWSQGQTEPPWPFAHLGVFSSSAVTS